MPPWGARCGAARAEASGIIPLAEVSTGRRDTITPVKPRQRLFAAIALFAVAFGALWPLVSQAHFGPPQIPTFLCTQSGFQHPGTPLPHEDRNHCPLCVVGADFTPPAPAPAVAPMPVALERAAIEGECSFHPGFLARPPPSRAPPPNS